MVKNRFFSVSARNPSIVRCCPRPTPSEITESSKSSLFTWWTSLGSCASLRTSNFMVGSTQWTPRLSTSVCRYSDGRNSEVLSLASKSTHRLISLQRFLYSTGSQMLPSMTLMQWTGSLTSQMPATSLTEDTLTLLDFMQSMYPWLSSLSEKSAGQNMKLWTEKNCSMERIMSFTTKQCNSQVRGIAATILPTSDVSSTMHQTCTAPLLITRTTSILPLRISRFFSDIDGRSNFSSNGLSSIFALKPFGGSLRMLSESRFMWQSSRTASLELLRSDSISIAQSFKSCGYSAVRCSSKRTSLNCFSALRRTTNRLMGSWKLTSILINNN